MAVVNWNEELKSVVNGSTAYVVSRQEYTVAQTSEIDDIDTTYLMQGSIVLDISTGKMHIWDGTAWVEVTNGGGGGGMSALMITWDLDTNLLDKTFKEISDHVAAGGVAYITDGDPEDNPPFVEYLMVGGVNIQEEGYQVWDSRGTRTWAATTINDYPEYTDMGGHHN